MPQRPDRKNLGHPALEGIMVKRPYQEPELEILGPLLGELFPGSSGPGWERPPAPACRPRGGGKIWGKKAAGAEVRGPRGRDESASSPDPLRRAIVLPGPGLRPGSGRGLHR